MRSRVATGAVLGALGLAQCVSFTDGIEVDVAYRSAANPSVVQTDLGYAVRLEQAAIAFGEIELIACAGTAAAERDGPFGGLWRAGSLAEAHAHTSTSPTRLGVPLVLNLMHSTGVPELAGTLRPPPGQYCGVRVTSTPADRDALGLDAAGQEMLERCVTLTGTAEGNGLAEASTFRIWLDEEFEREVLFDEPTTLGQELWELGLLVQVDYLHWLDGVDFQASSSTDAKRIVTQNILNSITVNLSNKGG